MGGNGGGSVQILARGTVSVKGVVSANGGFPNYSYGGGSGGGILIRCNHFTGDANGLLRANGAGGAGYYTGGGGGRIAVWRKYDPSMGLITATVDGGAGPLRDSGTVGTIVWVQVPIPGSIVVIR